MLRLGEAFVANGISPRRRSSSRLKLVRSRTIRRVNLRDSLLNLAFGKRYLARHPLVAGFVRNHNKKVAEVESTVNGSFAEARSNAIGRWQGCSRITIVNPRKRKHHLTETCSTPLQALLLLA